MADNKNQHYVPRCHLKPFSLNGEGRAINLFNLDLARPIPNAPLRNQCSADYFYGRDERLEDGIRHIEDGYAALVRDLRAFAGPLTSFHRAIMARFAFLQYLRTDAAARASVERLALMSDVPGAPPVVPTREVFADAVTAAMLTFAHCMRIVDDLKLCIVRNRTVLPFVTSDNPAVLTNRLYVQRAKTKGRGFGVRNSGALFVLPITPDLCGLLYDGDVYAIPNDRGWVDSSRVDEVAALNQHQYLHCTSNIYFRDWEERASIAAAAAAASKQRPAARYTVTHAVLDRATDWGKRYAVRHRDELQSGDEVLIHLIPNHPVPMSWPSFLRFRSSRKIYSNNSGTGFVRRWCIESGFVSGDNYRRVDL